MPPPAAVCPPEARRRIRIRIALDNKFKRSFQNSSQRVGLKDPSEVSTASGKH
jgi:hypothetical protein